MLNPSCLAALLRNCQIVRQRPTDRPARLFSSSCYAIAIIPPAGRSLSLLVVHENGLVMSLFFVDNCAMIPSSPFAMERNADFSSPPPRCCLLYTTVNLHFMARPYSHLPGCHRPTDRWTKNARRPSATVCPAFVLA